MSIKFNPSQWDSINKSYELWWSHQLSHPLVGAILAGELPNRPKPTTPLITQATCHDLSISAKDIIDSVDYELSTYTYHGAAYPHFNLACFGPGVIAAFLGAKLDNHTGQVWFHPEKIVPIQELYFKYDANNQWLDRIKSICYEGMQRWQGQVLIGMPDLGGILDILSTFLPADMLLLELYDHPDEVKRLVSQLHTLWLRYYTEINDVLQPINPGYSDWSLLYSNKPSYILQSDFSYMISTDMFNTFVKPELIDTCAHLSNTIYHLDGVGQLNHLESLLGIDTLNAVQWVPGSGQPDQSEWADIQCQIIKNDKNLYLSGGAYIQSFERLDKMISQLGSGKGIYMAPINGNLSHSKEILDKLAYYEGIN